jgi:hypothetical protein
MSMDSYEELQQKHQDEVAINYRAFAEQREQIRHDYAGQWVAFAFGRVISAGPDEDEVAAALDAVDPQATSGCVFRAEDDPVFEAIESVSSEFLPE